MNLKIVIPRRRPESAIVILELIFIADLDRLPTRGDDVAVKKIPLTISYEWDYI